MKHLANTLYITTPEAYISLDGETVVVKEREYNGYASAAAQPGKHRLLQLSRRQPCAYGSVRRTQHWALLSQAERALLGAGQRQTKGQSVPAQKTIRTGSG